MLYSYFLKLMNKMILKKFSYISYLWIQFFERIYKEKKLKVYLMTFVENPKILDFGNNFFDLYPFLI